eukprot:TRINITY_DN12244_c0_g1_i4.p1 TRINITY_DN12244_c0_g1~~TRINITY_DN12244_c0_g1_i4.p1  ORF type:complete len:283 (+),score=79.90 TRINITY_DN12244_c0_g1_i4:295-1143(+)
MGACGGKDGEERRPPPAKQQDAPSPPEAPTAPEPAPEPEPPAPAPVPEPAPAPAASPVEDKQAKEAADAARRSQAEVKRRDEKARMEKARREATAEKIKHTRVFGCTVAESSARSGGGVPAPIRECCRWIKEHGLQHVGLFRIPGRGLSLKYWKDLFNVDASTVLPEEEPVETATSLIIHFFKELKDEKGKKTYIWIKRDAETHKETYNLQTEMQVYRRKTKQQADLAFVRKGLKQIPALHRDILKEITCVLKAASEPENAAENKMNPYLSLIHISEPTRPY